MTGAGRAALLTVSQIEAARDDEYGLPGYRITEAGRPPGSGVTAERAGVPRPRPLP